MHTLQFLRSKQFIIGALCGILLVLAVQYFWKGERLASLLPLALVLLCPILMMTMMHGGHGHGRSHSDRGERPDNDHDHASHA